MPVLFYIGIVIGGMGKLIEDIHTSFHKKKKEKEQ